jgi:hypothetical protein
VVRALQLAAVGAILWVSSDQCVVRAAHVALGAGGAVLRDSHVTTSDSGGRAPDFTLISEPCYTRLGCAEKLSMRRGT